MIKNSKSQIPSIKENIYDLENRCIKFSISIIRLSKTLKNNIENKIIFRQIIRSATSVGPNYIEANECVTKKDRIYKISLSKKEAKETKYWITLLKHTNDKNVELDYLEDETSQLIKIFQTILNKLKI